MRKIKILTRAALFLLSLVSQNIILSQQPSHPNVLFIAVDDLNDWVGPLNGYKGVKTPNIDKLAKMGMNFTRAYCSAPICNPSRASLLTGIRPSSSGVYYNIQPWRPAMPNAITIPQYFKANGYEVVGTGKVFHNIFNDSASWFVYYPIPRSPQPANSPAHGLMKLVGASPGFDWSSLVESDEEMGDFKTVQRGIDYLNEKHQKPFFLAVGLIRPHLPMYAPQKYFDLYPLSKIKTPAVIKNDLDDVSPLAVEIAHNKFARQNRQVPLDSGNHNFIVNNNQWEKAVQAYLASISFADAQVGRLMNALENSPYKNNTIIVFFGDNGWHLGEKDHWGKSTLWEESGHVPFIIVAPGFTKPNSICERTVSLMDIYPTLINLCKLPAKPGIEAMDITPLLKNPKLEWNYPAITTYGPGNHAVRTERWRYIRYNDKTEELYDHNADPNEWNNLAKDPKYADTIKRLSVWLPKTNAAPAAFIERPRE